MAKSTYGPVLPDSLPRKDWRALTRTPITEALLELRFEPTEETTLASLDDFSGSDRSAFPFKQPLFEQAISVQIQAAAPSTATANQQPIGFLLHNKTRDRALMPRVDRFGMAYLPPYRPWPSLLEDTKTHYQRFQGMVPHGPITRLGMRYINRLEIVADERHFNLDHYLKVGPRLPIDQGLVDVVGWHESTYAMPLLRGDDPFYAVVRQKIEQLTERDNRLLQVVWLDIDIAYELRTQYAMDNLWDRFETMRQARNMIFYGTFTDAALAEFR